MKKTTIKKASITLSILFSFLLASSQTVKHQPTPTAKYTFKVDELLLNSLGLEQLNESSIGVGGMDKNREKWKVLMKSSYRTIQNKISSKLKGLKILPLNTLEGKIKYSKLDFPSSSSLKKAASSCDYSQLLQLNISVGSHGLNKTSRVGDKDETNLTSTSLLPTVNITMSFYDSQTKKTTKIKGTSLREDTDRMTVEKLNTNNKLLRTETILNEYKKIKYQSYLDLAIEDLINNLLAE